MSTHCWYDKLIMNTLIPIYCAIVLMQWLVSTTKLYWAVLLNYELGIFFVYRDKNIHIMANALPFEYYGHFKSRKKHVKNTNAKLAS